MKIAIIADALDYQYAGIYYYTKELINALALVDHENEYLIVRSRSEGDISKNVRELILPVKKIPGAAAYRLFYSIPRVLTRLNVDVVIEPRHFGPFNLPDHIKRVTVIHDLSPLHFPQWHQVISRTLQKLFLPAILKRTDHIITNSAFTARDVVNHFPFAKNKITGIQLGKENFFQFRSDPAVLEKYKIKEPFLLHTGTIEPRKNLSLLVKAFNRIKQQIGSPLQLVLLGKQGWKSESLMDIIHQSPFRKDICLPGYAEREELPIIYSAATAFVYPSYFEGFGLPVLEAMACGVPVVVSNASSLPEIAGEAGLYFSPDNQETLIKHILSLLKNPSLRQTQSKKSMAQAQKFSWERTAKETLEVLMDLT